MRTEKLTWGIILIFIGTIFLLTNLGVIDFYWRSVWRLWPAVLIIAGVNIILSRYMPRGGSLVAAAITLIILGFVAFAGMRPSDHNSNRAVWHFKNDEPDNGVRNSKFSEPFITQTKFATLNIIGGAASYTLTDSTTNLIDAKVSDDHGRYTLKRTTVDSTETLTLRLMDGKRNWNLDDDGFKATINLNKLPVWDIDMKIGAGEANFDLSDFKVRRLDVRGGAASFKLKLGEPQQVTNIEVETGLADTDIRIPKEAACKITVKTGLSSEDFKGFEKSGNNTYITKGYHDSIPHFNISLKGGLADFEVRRY